VKPQLIEDFVKPGKVFFEYRDYAFLGPESASAAEAAYCAAEQDQFWQYHATIFENQGKSNTGAYSDARLREMAEGTGLDMPTYDACMSSDAPAAEVAAMLAEAQAGGINSTPSVVVDGVKVDWQGYDALKPAIEAALAEKGA
jgi:protein-disulfide isomerase